LSKEKERITMSYEAKPKELAHDLIYTMNNLELLEYKRELDRYKSVLQQHIKDWARDRAMVSRLLKERMEDLEIEEILVQIEREECDLWQLEQITKIH